MLTSLLQIYYSKPLRFMNGLTFIDCLFISTSRCDVWCISLHAQDTIPMYISLCGIPLKRIVAVSLPIINSNKIMVWLIIIITSFTWVIEIFGLGFHQNGYAHPNWKNYPVNIKLSMSMIYSHSYSRAGKTELTVTDCLTVTVNKPHNCIVIITKT